jgi:DNA-binding XRE family transcriptional regulator
MDLGLLQREVAKQIGCSKAALVMWEKGYSNPEIRFWPGIIEFLGYDPGPEPRDVPGGLRAARRRLGLSRHKMAVRLEVDSTSIRDWEAGRPIRFHRCQTILKEMFDELNIEFEDEAAITSGRATTHGFPD